MAVSTFDTLKFALALKAAGVPEKQAAVLGEALQFNLREVATKDDLKAMEDRLTARFDALEDRLTGRSGALEERLTGTFDALEDRLTGKFEALEERLNGRSVALEDRLTGRSEALEDRLNAKIDLLSARFDTMKWLMGFVLASLVAILIRLFFIRSPI